MGVSPRVVSTKVSQVLRLRMKATSWGRSMRGGDCSIVSTSTGCRWKVGQATLEDGEAVFGIGGAWVLGGVDAGGIDESGEDGGGRFR